MFGFCACAENSNTIVYPDIKIISRDEQNVCSLKHCDFTNFYWSCISLLSKNIIHIYIILLNFN